MCWCCWVVMWNLFCFTHHVCLSTHGVSKSEWRGKRDNEYMAAKFPMIPIALMQVLSLEWQASLAIDIWKTLCQRHALFTLYGCSDFDWDRCLSLNSAELKCSMCQRPCSDLLRQFQIPHKWQSSYTKHKRIYCCWYYRFANNLNDFL